MGDCWKTLLAEGQAPMSFVGSVDKDCRDCRYNPGVRVGQVHDRAQYRRPLPPDRRFYHPWRRTVLAV